MTRWSGQEAGRLLSVVAQSGFLTEARTGLFRNRAKQSLNLG
jgi:hypothetical protein